VFGPDGLPVHVGLAQIDDDDRAHLSVVLQPGLTPGTYRVTWRTLSAEDGDTEEGEFAFRVDPQAAVTSTPMGEKPTSSPPTSVPPTASQATVPPPPPPEASPLASPEAPLATPTEGLPAGGGCGLGLLPLAGLLGIACLPRRARR
jgi:cell division septation protein DedD